jgi:hypothetical protein
MISAETLIEVLGWMGAVILLVAYAIVSYGPIDGRSRLYQSLNVIASLMLATNSAWHGAWPSAALNVIWTVIAVGTLIPALKRRREAL